MKLKNHAPQQRDYFENFKKFFQNRNSQFALASVAFAFAISFSFIGLLRTETNGQSLMASVANISGEQTAPAVDFTADTALVDKTSYFEMISGKKMQNVEFIEGIIALDPSRSVEISSQNVKLDKIENGIYHFRFNAENKSFLPGEKIFDLKKSSEVFAPLTITDLQFVSAGERYNLSNIVK